MINYLVKRMLEDKKPFINCKWSKMKVDWDKIAEGIWELSADEFLHKLPTVGRRLEDRFKRHLNAGFTPESFIDKHFLSKSVAIVKTDVQES